MGWSPPVIWCQIPDLFVTYVTGRPDFMTESQNRYFAWWVLHDLFHTANSYPWHCLNDHDLLVKVQVLSKLLGRDSIHVSERPGEIRRIAITKVIGDVGDRLVSLLQAF